MAHAHRLRTGRFSAPGRIYLITTACWRRKQLFTDLYSARAVVRTFQDLQPSTDTLCYVVMPDHVHWLMQLQPGADLSDVVKLMKSLATRRVKECRPGLKEVWQRGFHDRALRDEDDLRAVARYVVANPLRAGLVESVGDYSFWDATWL